MPATRLRTLPPKLLRSGQRVLVRVDFNVPLERARGAWRVADDTRLRDALPTMARLRRAGARIILLTHLGEPRGQRVRSLGLRPVFEELQRLLPKALPPTHLASSWNFPQLRSTVARLRPGEALLLPNVRFCPGEERNAAGFARQLASLAECYVNEAFSVSHRRHASVSAVTRYLPSYAGWRLAEEVAVLERLRVRPAAPFVVVLGGAKVHDKIGMMIHLAPRASVILAGGVVANTLLTLTGRAVGRSRTDRHPRLRELRRLLRIRRRYPGERRPLPFIQLPSDVVVARRPTGVPRRVSFTAGEVVAPDETLYDIGPDTTERFTRLIARARTIVWNGPMGFIEVPRFRRGSLAVARAVTRRARSPRCLGVVGGGESVAVLDETGLAQSVDYVSTGGGAMLEYLSGATLPGLAALRRP